MKSMIFAALVLACFSTSVGLASTSLDCQFLPTAHLSDVRITVGATKSSLDLTGTDGEDQIRLNPKGEKVVLNRRADNGSGWLGFDGSSCQSDANSCKELERGYSLNLPKSGLSSSKEFEAELQMTQMSGYLPGATYYSYSIRCSKAKP